MAESSTLLAIFPDVEPAADAIEQLHALGIQDEQMDVISGVPLLEHAIGRPNLHTNVPRLALMGAGLGLILGLFLAFGTPYLFTLHVGGQPVFPIPPGIIIVFEMSMLGVMGMAFLGVIVENLFPVYKPLKYDHDVSDGKIAVLFDCPTDDTDKFVKAMQEHGAETVEPAEERQL